MELKHQLLSERSAAKVRALFGDGQLLNDRFVSYNPADSDAGQEYFGVRTEVKYASVGIKRLNVRLTRSFKAKFAIRIVLDD